MSFLGTLFPSRGNRLYYTWCVCDMKMEKMGLAGVNKIEPQREREREREREEMVSGKIDSIARRERKRERQE